MSGDECESAIGQEYTFECQRTLCGYSRTVDTLAEACRLIDDHHEHAGHRDYTVTRNGEVVLP